MRSFAYAPLAAGTQISVVQIVTVILITVAAAGTLSGIIVGVVLSQPTPTATSTPTPTPFVNTSANATATPTASPSPTPILPFFYAQKNTGQASTTQIQPIQWTDVIESVGGGTLSASDSTFIAVPEECAYVFTYELLIKDAVAPYATDTYLLNNENTIARIRYVASSTALGMAGSAMRWESMPNITLIEKDDNALTTPEHGRNYAQADVGGLYLNEIAVTCASTQQGVYYETFSPDWQLVVNSTALWTNVSKAIGNVVYSADTGKIALPSAGIYMINYEVEIQGANTLSPWIWLETDDSSWRYAQNKYYTSAVQNASACTGLSILRFAADESIKLHGDFEGQLLAKRLSILQVTDSATVPYILVRKTVPQVTRDATVTWDSIVDSQSDMNLTESAKIVIPEDGIYTFSYELSIFEEDADAGVALVAWVQKNGISERMYALNYFYAGPAGSGDRYGAITGAATLRLNATDYLTVHFNNMWSDPGETVSLGGPSAWEASEFAVVKIQN